MELPICGKGGVGKTTLTALPAAGLACRGRQGIALDADPDANPAAAPGLAPDQQPTPPAGMRELIAERTGAQDGCDQFFKLTPKVGDVPERCTRAVSNMRLLMPGGVSGGAAAASVPLRRRPKRC